MAARFDTGSMESYGAVQAAGTDVTVPDAALLFTGDYSRAGTDLVITGSDGAKFVVSGYFETDTPPSLLSPTGGSLTGDVVTALAGPQFPAMYAQAGGGGGSGLKEIGKVQTLDGSATVIRADGVTETLSAGDPVYEGDVVQTGPGSKLGIGFVDGTVFSMSANARMVLNKLVFNADGSDNSMLFSLVEGSFVFAAGKIAPTGDMKIQTPVATMGIRGTAPTVDIIQTALGQVVNFSIVPNPGDGHIGNYTLYNNLTGEAIGTISDTGSTWSLNINGTITQFEKTQDDLLRDAETITQINNVYTTYVNNGGPNPQAGPDNNPPSSGLNTNPPGENNEGDPQNNNSPNINPNDDPPPGTTPGSGNQTNNDPPPIIDDPDDPGINVITFGDGDDTITGTNGNDFIIAGGGNDHITALDGNDQVFGGDGDDIIVGGTGGGDDHYDGGEGTDTLVYTSTGPGEGVTIDLTTEPGTVTGPATGNDTFTSIEKFVGGGGDDTLIVNADTGWFFDGRGGTDTIEFAGDLNIDTSTYISDATSVEVIDLNTSGSNTLTIEADAFKQSGDNNTIKILGGGQNADTVNLTNEYFVEVDGNEVLLNGFWDDAQQITENGTTFFVYKFYVSGSSEPVATALIEDGIAVNRAPAVEQEIGDQSVKNDFALLPIALTSYFTDFDDGDSLEFAVTQADGSEIPTWLTLSSEGTLSGTPPNNSVFDVVVTATDDSGLTAQQEFTIRTGIIGTDDGEYLRGSNGGDVIAGLDGSDRIEGRRGDDQLFGDDGNDDISGGRGKDTIHGGGGSDHISGGRGNDTIFGGDGEDEIYGGSGNDTIDGGDGDDDIVGDSFVGIFGGDDTIFGGGGDDIIIGDNIAGLFGGDDTIDGGDGDDVIFGDSFLTLFGGDDTITGGAGDDIITGGGGADTFAFGPGEGTDTITDFEGIDALDLSAFLVEPIGSGDLGQVIQDYISTITENGDTTVYVDPDGVNNSDGGANEAPVAIAVLNNYDAADGIRIAVDGHEPVVYTPPEAV